MGKSTLDQQRLKQALKSILKERGLTFKDVASEWNCSIPTVKRLLGREEMPLSRLLALLDWLGLTFAGLEKRIEAERQPAVRLSPKQNAFLAENPHYCAFLLRLYDGETPQSIQKQEGLSSLAIERYLIRLEKHDLLKISKSGKVTLNHLPMFLIEGPLAQAHYRNLIRNTSAYFERKISEGLSKPATSSQRHGSYAFSVVMVTEKTFDEFTQRLNQVVEDTERIASLESQFQNRQKLKALVMMTGYFLDSPNSRDLESLTKPMGKISPNP